jgi:hypothetical protein
MSVGILKALYKQLEHTLYKARRHNITYTQAGFLCFVGQERGKFNVQFFEGSSVVKIPACV